MRLLTSNICSIHFALLLDVHSQYIRELGALSSLATVYTSSRIVDPPKVYAFSVGDLICNVHPTMKMCGLMKDAYRMRAKQAIH